MTEDDEIIEAMARAIGAVSSDSDEEMALAALAVAKPLLAAHFAQMADAHIFADTAAAAIRQSAK